MHQNVRKKKRSKPKNQEKKKLNDGKEESEFVSEAEANFKSNDTKADDRKDKDRLWGTHRVLSIHIGLNLILCTRIVFVNVQTFSV